MTIGSPAHAGIDPLEDLKKATYERLHKILRMDRAGYALEAARIVLELKEEKTSTEELKAKLKQQGIIE